MSEANATSSKALHPPTTSNPPIFNRIPTEIIMQILKNLVTEPNDANTDTEAATCFGLTCRRHWSIFKDIHRALFWVPENCDKGRFLSDFLPKWMGDQYKRPVIGIPHLPCTTVGNPEETKEKEWETRYSAHHTTKDHCSADPMIDSLNAVLKKYHP